MQMHFKSGKETLHAARCNDDVMPIPHVDVSGDLSLSFSTAEVVEVEGVSELQPEEIANPNDR
jgi:hypothetical protein